jgi:sugar-specific transcriptional regulator TrmB
MDERLVARLTRLGLTMYEAKAYMALVRRDSSTAAELARIAGVPRQRIYDVLASLVERGLASTRPGKVVKYAAAPPELALARLLDDHRRRVEELELDASAVAEQLTPAYAAGQGHTDPLDYIEVLRDRGAINERFSQLQAGIEREILIFSKPPYATPPENNEQGLEVSRRHTARSLYEFSVFDSAETTEGVRRFIEAGEEARFVAELPLKLVILDETIVMFGMEDPVAGTPDLTIVVVEHRSLAKVLKIAFMSVWNQGLTFEHAHDLLVARHQRATVAS